LESEAAVDRIVGPVGEVERSEGESGIRKGLTLTRT
jgi:hypothetical protein